MAGHQVRKRKCDKQTPVSWLAWMETLPNSPLLLNLNLHNIVGDDIELEGVKEAHLDHTHRVLFLVDANSDLTLYHLSTQAFQKAVLFRPLTTSKILGPIKGITRLLDLKSSILCTTETALVLIRLPKTINVDTEVIYHPEDRADCIVVQKMRNEDFGITDVSKTQLFAAHQPDSFYTIDRNMISKFDFNGEWQCTSNWQCQFPVYHMIVSQEWLFILSPNNTLFITNTSRFFGPIDLSISLKLGTAKLQPYLSVTPDLTRLAVVSNANIVYSINIDNLFAKQPVSQVPFFEKVEETEEDEEESDEEQSAEEMYVWDADLDCLIQPKTMPTQVKWINTPKTKALAWIPTIHRTTPYSKSIGVNGFSLSKEHDIASILHFQQPLPFDLNEVRWISCNQETVLVHCRPAGSIHQYMCYVEDGRATTLQLPFNALPLQHAIDFLVLSPRYISAVLPPSLTQDSLTDNLILFDIPGLARHMFELNGWDVKTLNIYTLKVGLKHRQLDVIIPAIRAIDEEQHQKASHILASFIKKNYTQATQDQHFWDDLLQVSMEFISRIIEQKASKLSSATQFPDLQVYAKLLSVLRKSEKKMKQPAPLPDISLFVSPIPRKGKRGAQSFVSDIEATTSESDDFLNSFTPSLHEESKFLTEKPEETNFLSLQDVYSIAGKINESEEMSGCFSNYRYRWEKLSDLAIIYDALNHSNLSMALTFLKWRRQVFSKEIPGRKINSLEDVKEVTGSLVYQALKAQNLPLAKKMISAIGEQKDVHFEAVLWNTSVQAIRSLLLPEITRARFSEAELETISYMKQIEELYPRTTLQCAEDETVAGDVVPPENVFDIPNKLSVETPHDPAAGFLHAKLSWFHSLDAVTKTRISIEGVVISEKDQDLIATCEHTVLLDYLVSHNDLEGIKYFLQQIDLPDGCALAADGTIDSEAHSVILEHINKHLESESTSRYVKQAICAELATRKIIILPSTDDAATLQALGRNAMLFSGDSLTKLFLPCGQMSDFHQYFIRLCIANRFTNILEAYLVHYQLDTSRETMEALSKRMPSDTLPNWFNLMMNLRSDENIFEASLYNAKSCLKSKDNVTLASMMTSTSQKKRPMMALGSLMYAPVSISEAVMAEKSSKWFIDKRQLLDFLSRFPQLKDAIFPEVKMLTQSKSVGLDFMSSKRDVNLAHLIAQNSAVNLENALRTDLIEINAVQMADRRFEDEIDISYYLLQGEPMRASLLLQASDTEISSIVPTIRLLALSNNTNKETLASCYSLLELSGVNATTIKIEVECLRAIVDAELMDTDEAIELFMAFHDTESDFLNKDIIEEAVELLESALEKHDSKPGVFTNRWMLVCLFCQAYNIRISRTAMKKAVSDAPSWAMSFYQLQTLQIPLSDGFTLLEDVEDPTLKEHLMICLRQLAYDTNCQSIISVFEKTNFTADTDVLETIIHALGKIYPGEELLKMAVELKMPMLAVVAPSFPDVDLLNALLVWFYVVIYKIGDHNDPELQADFVNFEKIHASQFKERINTFSLTSSQDTSPHGRLLDSLGAFIHYCYGKKFFHFVYRAFEMFDNGNPLMQLSNFIMAFHEQRYDACAPILKAFILALHAKKLAVGNIDWAAQLVDELLSNAIHSGMPSHFERHEFLKLLASAAIDEKYDSMLFEFELLEQMNLLGSNTEFIIPAPTDLLNELLQRGRFELATQFAARRSLDVNYIIIKEAEYMISLAMNQKSVWEVPTERMQLWSQINSLLLHKKCLPKAAGQFLMDRAKIYENILKDIDKVPINEIPETLTVQEAAEEQLTLLSLARPWFDGSHNVTTDQFTTKAWKSDEFLQDLDSQLLRVSVIAQSGSTALVREKILHKLDKGMLGDEAVESTIGKLLNSDAFAEAKKLSAEMGVASSDLMVVEAMFAVIHDDTSFDRFTTTVQTVMNNKYPNTDLINITATRLLELLSRCATFAALCCERIVVKYKVARLFAVPYDNISEKNPYDVLQFLIMEGLGEFILTKHYIQSHSLESEKIAEVLAERCFKALLEADGKANQLLSPSKAAKAKTEDFIVGSLSRPVMFSPPTNTDAPKIASTPEIVNDDKNTTPFWSTRALPNYIDLTQHPALIGDELLRLANKQLSIAPSIEIEVYIRALMAYLAAQDVQKQDHLFALIRDKVNVYVKQKQFRWLVRLVTGTKQYNQLQYIFDVLIQNDKFELLLSKNTYFFETEVAKKELQFALYSFLKLNYPNNTEMFKLLYMRFNMFREFADQSQERAWALLNGMKTKLDPNALISSMEYFIEAANGYAKDGSYSLERKCVDMANLINLQFSIPDIRVVNLKDAEAQEFLYYCGDFDKCLVVANAYGLNTVNNWLEPLYYQVVLMGNSYFYEMFRESVSYDVHELFSMMVKRYCTESAPSKSLEKNMRSFLEYLDDHYERLRLVHECRFSDMVDQLTSVLGADYFVKLIPTD